MAETLTEPVATAGETTQSGPAPAKQDEKKIQRQMVSFTFFKVMPEWRRLPAGGARGAQAAVRRDSEALEPAGTDCLALRIRRSVCAAT